MNKQEFNEKLTAIGTCEDEAQRRGLIADLMEEGGKIYDEHAAAVQQRDQFAVNNEELRAENKRLFMRVGDHQEPAQPKGQEPKTKRSFADLFNEKGGLK